MKQILLMFFLCLPYYFLSQNITGQLLDKKTKEPIVTTKIISNKGLHTLTDENGRFSLQINSFPSILYFNNDDYYKDSLIVSHPENIVITLTKKAINNIENIVISASRHGQKEEQVPISMNILKPTLINDKGTTTIDQAINQVPSVYSMDGQISIRGGSGYSYGAGSRVMVLWNEMPMLSPDAGDVKWNTIPMELTSRVEVIKGASSVLYGSGALNGIIAIAERTPIEQPYYNARIQYGIYDKPQRVSLRQDKPLMSQLVEFATGHKKGNFFYNIGVDMYNTDGYRQGEIERRARISGSLGYNFSKIRGLQMGVGYSAFIQKLGSFLIWESDSLAYTPLGGADIHNTASTLAITNGLRIMIDPYIKYIGPKNWKHNLRTRIYSVNNKSETDTSQSSLGNSFYADYLGQKNFGNHFLMSVGATYLGTFVKSRLYNNHHSDNLATYLQLEKKWGNFTLTGGLRFEYYNQDNNQVDSYLYLNKKDSSKAIPVYPIFRFAGVYQAGKSTFIRASFGQGVRYPATSERYVHTSVGALNIFSNPNLKREEGYAGEVGVKQVFMSKNGTWKGILDVAGYINRYKNMTEFTFGVYNPKGMQLNLNPNSPAYLLKWIGFRAENAESAQILGIDISFASEGKISDVTIRTLVGYTYMNPISLNKDSIYRSNFSDTSTNMLKYRFNHLAKADIEIEYKGFSVGFSGRYNSYMKNIDRIFEDGIFGQQILKGLKRYREEHHTGSIVFDARIAYEFKKHYRVSIISNNIFNAEYMGRPGDIRPPRSFIAQLQLKF